MKTGMALVATLLLGWASPASAQAVKLEFRNGLVSLSAQNAPLRAILAEWTRLGGTKIVNGDRVPGAPITIQLTAVPERQAIDVLLRSAAGYIAGPRQAGSAGTSALASIVILPSSAAGPRQVSTTPIAQPPRLQVPQRELEPDDPEDDPPTDIADPDDRPVPANVRQAAEAARQRAAERRQQLFVGDNIVIEQQGPEIQRTTPPPANNPFGIVPGSVRPGIVAPPPPQTDDRRQRADQEP
jgi:hypothetical protein